ncbi:MAG: hypothetical protein HOO96_11745 [Polyangiaceae bacterium]|nr:hypothetical protein [Polyangiaceae bacterium]
MVVGSLFLMAGVAAAVGTAMPTTRDTDAIVMGRIEACPAAVELLGSPATNQVWTFSGGGFDRQRGAFREIDRSEVVRGAKAKGTVHYVIEQRGGPLTLLRATLSVGSTEVDLVACSSGATK